MSQSRAQQLSTPTWELTGCEIQAFQGLVDFKGQGEISPLPSGGRTRPQPVGYMGESHASERTERPRDHLSLSRVPEGHILEFHFP